MRNSDVPQNDHIIRAHSYVVEFKSSTIRKNRTYGALRCLGHFFTPQNHCVILWGYEHAAPRRVWISPDKK